MSSQSDSEAIISAEKLVAMTPDFDPADETCAWATGKLELRIPTAPANGGVLPRIRVMYFNEERKQWCRLLLISSQTIPVDILPKGGKELNKPGEPRKVREFDEVTMFVRKYNGSHQVSEDKSTFVEQPSDSDINPLFQVVERVDALITWRVEKMRELGAGFISTITAAQKAKADINAAIDAWPSREEALRPNGMFIETKYLPMLEAYINARSLKPELKKSIGPTFGTLPTVKNIISNLQKISGLPMANPIFNIKFRFLRADVDVNTVGGKFSVSNALRICVAKTNAETKKVISCEPIEVDNNNAHEVFKRGDVITGTICIDSLALAHGKYSCPVSWQQQCILQKFIAPERPKFKNPLDELNHKFGMNFQMEEPHATDTAVVEEDSCVATTATVPVVVDSDIDDYEEESGYG